MTLHGRVALPPLPEYNRILPSYFPVLSQRLPVPSLLPMDPSPVLSQERERVLRRVDGFNWRESPAWLELVARYGPRLSQEELVSIADLASNGLQIRLDRDARRRKSVMIKWFEEHWDRILALLPIIVLGDS
jgi:uncharacterized protein YbjT (DUF2867 family)